MKSFHGHHIDDVIEESGYTFLLTLKATCVLRDSKGENKITTM